MNPDAFFLVGKVVKSSGSNGDVIVLFQPGINIDIQKLESVFIRIKGELIPFFIDRLNTKSNNQANVRFMDYDTQDEVSIVLGASIFLPKPAGKKSRKNLDPDITGYRVTDINYGDIGEVVSLLELPMHEVLEVRFGDKLILIPVSESIILEINSKARKIMIEAPEGLIELYM